MTVDQMPPISVRIAFIEELDATVIAPWLLKLTGKFPNISFALSGGASNENHKALSTRAVDLMLAVDTVAQADWVEQHPVLRDPFILVTAPQMGNAPDLDLLNTGPFVRYSTDLQIGCQIEAQLRRSGMQPVRGYEFSTNQALFAMTAELGGWAIIRALAYFGTPRMGFGGGASVACCVLFTPSCAARAQGCIGRLAAPDGRGYPRLPSRAYFADSVSAIAVPARRVPDTSLNRNHRFLIILYDCATLRNLLRFIVQFAKDTL